MSSRLFLLFNQHTGGVSWKYPPLKTDTWSTIVDTSKESPADFVTPEQGEFPRARKSDDRNGHDRYDHVDNLDQAGFKRWLKSWEC